MKLPSQLRQYITEDPSLPIQAVLDNVIREADWVRHLPPVLDKCRPRKRPAGWIRAGDLYTPCDRLLAGVFCGQTRHSTYSTHTLELFENGTFMHLRYYMWFSLFPKPWRTEAPRQLAVWPVVGELDVDVEHPQFGWWPLELKSMNSLEYSGLYAPLEDHRLQLNTYLGLAGARHGQVWYENKNNQDRKCFPIEFNHIEYDQVVSRATGIARSLSRGRLPAACTSCSDPGWCKALRVTARARAVCERNTRV